MSGAAVAVTEVHSVQDAMRLSEEAVEAEASKFNADGSPKDPAGVKADTDKTATAGGEGGNKDEGGEPQGVVTADGKHIMPYSVVKGARDAQAQAEQQAREAAQREQDAVAAAEALRVELAALKAGKGAGAEEIAATDDNLKTLREQAEAIRADLPAMASMFDTLIKEVETTRAKLAQHDEAETTRATEAEHEQTAALAEVKTRVRTAIDNNPTLAAWEVENVPAFNRAVDFDEVLKNDPTWKGKSYGERFAHAVKLTLTDMPSAKEAAAPKQRTQELDTDVQARAAKALKDAGDVTVAGLSDLPGGAPPGGNPLENIEAMPAAELANKMAGMSQAQLEAFIVKHG